MPKISIILPIYNVAKHLPKCIDSVLNQTLQDIEVILATDGPADCDAICNDYAQKDKRIKIISHPGSYGKAINQGIDIATGEYIGIVETDDWCDLTMFEKLYQAAKQYDADVAKSGFYCVKKRILKKKAFTTETRLLTIDNDKDFFDFQPSLWSAIYKTSFLRNNNITFVEERLSFIDTPFVLETFIKSNRFIHIPEALYYYNCDNSEASVKNSEKVIDAIKAEEFLLSKLDSQTFQRIKKEYLVGLASRLKWNLKRIKKEENKALFWKYAHEYVRKIGASKEYLSLFSDELLKQILAFVYQTDEYKKYKEAVYSKKEFKFLGIPLLTKETIAWKKTTLYLFNIIPLGCVKTNKGKNTYKLFNILPIYKTERIIK